MLNCSADSSQLVVQSCTDKGTGTWCCRGEGEASCCNEAFETDVGVLLLPTVTMSASQTTATTSLASNSPSLTCSSSCPQPTKDNSTVVGGAVGGVLGAALLASLGTLAWRERTRPKHSADQSVYPIFQDSHGDDVRQMKVVDPTHHEIGSGERHELDSRS